MLWTLESAHHACCADHQMCRCGESEQYHMWPCASQRTSPGSHYYISKKRTIKSILTSCITVIQCQHCILPWSLQHILRRSSVPLSPAFRTFAPPHLQSPQHHGRLHTPITVHPSHSLFSEAAGRSFQARSSQLKDRFIRQALPLLPSLPLHLSVFTSCGPPQALKDIEISTPNCVYNIF